MRTIRTGETVRLKHDALKMQFFLIHVTPHFTCKSARLFGIHCTMVGRYKDLLCEYRPLKVTRSDGCKVNLTFCYCEQLWLSMSRRVTVNEADVGRCQ